MPPPPPLSPLPALLLAFLPLPQDAMKTGRPLYGYPHAQVQYRAPGDSVVGSQPVSLDRQNLVLLHMKR